MHPNQRRRLPATLGRTVPTGSWSVPPLSSHCWGKGWIASQHHGRILADPLLGRDPLSPGGWMGGLAGWVRGPGLACIQTPEIRNPPRPHCGRRHVFSLGEQCRGEGLEAPRPPVDWLFLTASPHLDRCAFLQDNNGPSRNPLLTLLADDAASLNSPSASLGKSKSSPEIQTDRTVWTLGRRNRGALVTRHCQILWRRVHAASPISCIFRVLSWGGLAVAHSQPRLSSRLADQCGDQGFGETCKPSSVAMTEGSPPPQPHLIRLGSPSFLNEVCLLRGSQQFRA